MRVHRKMHPTTGHEKSCIQYKKQRTDDFDLLPDDLIITMFRFLSSAVKTPADFINIMLTCKRFYGIALHPIILRNVAIAALHVKAISWSEGAHRFLMLCAQAGNTEACYVLGMIYFYCLHKRCEGATLMAKAALASHSYALHAMAIIQFNGSGGTRMDKNLKSGVSLSARAAVLGHVDAIRELGHCVHDGYGVTQNLIVGQRLILEAHTRELIEALTAVLEVQLSQTVTRFIHHPLLDTPCLRESSHVVQSIALTKGHPMQRQLLHIGGCDILLTDFDCSVAWAHNHIANQFLADWFCLHPLPPCLQLCFFPKCGRPETREQEFRRCSACGRAVYCSRACQAWHWKLSHKYECSDVLELENIDNHFP